VRFVRRSSVHFVVGLYCVQTKASSCRCHEWIVVLTILPEVEGHSEVTILIRPVHS